MRHHKHAGDYFGAFLLLAIGSIFLANNFELLPWTVWEYLWRFWPIFLIPTSLQILAGKNTFAHILVSIISIILTTIAMIYAISMVNLAFNRTMRKSLPFWPRPNPTFRNNQIDRFDPFFPDFQNEINYPAF